MSAGWGGPAWAKGGASAVRGALMLHCSMRLRAAEQAVFSARGSAVGREGRSFGAFAPGRR
jgi:hypothetical protein